MSSHALFDSSTLSLLMIMKQMQTVAMTIVNTIIQAKHVFIYLFSIMSLRPAGVCVLSVVPRCFDMQAWIHGSAVCLLWLQGLAFVGSEVITFNAVTNSALQAEWLAALLQVIHFRSLTTCHVSLGTCI